MISAKIREYVVTKAGNSSICFATNLKVSNLPAPMSSCLNVLAPPFNPLNWFNQLHGDPTKQSFFGVDIQLGTETATHFRRDHAQLVFRNTNHQRELCAQQVRDLCRRPDGQLFFTGKISRQDPPAFHSNRSQALMN